MPSTWYMHCMSPTWYMLCKSPTSLSGSKQVFHNRTCSVSLLPVCPAKSRLSITVWWLSLIVSSALFFVCLSCMFQERVRWFSPRFVQTIWSSWLSPFMMFQAVVPVGGKYGPLCSGPLCQVATVCMGFPAQLYRRWGHLWTEMAANCPMNISEQVCLLLQSPNLVHALYYVALWFSGK
jgi:hypothetical protein